MPQKRRKKPAPLRTTVSLPAHVAVGVEQLQEQTGWSPPEAINHLVQAAVAWWLADADALDALVQLREATIKAHATIVGAGERAMRAAKKSIPSPSEASKPADGPKPPEGRKNA